MADDQSFQVAAAAAPNTVMPIDQSNPAGHIEKLLGQTYGNGQCVGIVQDPRLGGAVGQTSSWSPGGPVAGDTQMGAPLAIFHGGQYLNKTGMSHAVRMMRRFDDGSFLALEQYVDKNGNQVPAKLTLIPNTGKGGEYDASSYQVINDKGGATKVAAGGDDDLVKKYNQLHAPTMSPADTNKIAANPGDDALIQKYNEIHGTTVPTASGNSDNPEGGPTVLTTPATPSFGNYLLGQGQLGLGAFNASLPMSGQRSAEALRAGLPPGLAAKMERQNAGAFQGATAPTNQDVYGSETVVAPPYSRYPGAVIRGVASNPALAAMAPGAMIGSSLGGQVGADVAPSIGLPEDTGRAIGTAAGGFAGYRGGGLGLPKSGVQMTAPPVVPPVIPAPAVTRAALNSVLTRSVPIADMVPFSSGRAANNMINAVVDPALKAQLKVVSKAIEGMTSNRPGQIVGVRNVINDKIASLQNSTSSSAQTAIDELTNLRSSLEGVLERHNPGSTAALTAHDAAVANAAMPPPVVAPPVQQGLGARAWNLAKIATPIIADHYLAGGTGLGLAYSVMRKIGRNIP